MSEESEILQQTVIEEEESPKSALAEKLKKRKLLKKKQRNKIIMILVAMLLFSYVIWWGIKPFKASAEYGICRSLLELQVPYPHTIHVSELKFQRNGGMKLWYSYIDAFGEYRLEDFICKLQQNPETGYLEIAELKMHKIYLDPEKIKFLNNAMPYFAENPVILNWPRPLPNSLNDLHFDIDSFRRIIINPTRSTL